MSDGLYRFVVYDDYIQHGRWLRARAEGSWVGECRTCGGYLAPEEPWEHNHRTDYEAACIKCGHVVMAPNGRVLRESGRHSQMPGDWWDKRLAALRASKGAAA